MKTTQFSNRLNIFVQNILDIFAFSTAREESNYETWQQHFMQKRLRLIIGIAILGFLTSIPINLSSYLIDKEASAGLWLISNFFIEVSMLICWRLLKTPIGRRHLNLIFLIFSWCITLSGPFLETLSGKVFPDIINWTIIFFTQATLIPIRWRIHLVSQLGVFFYYFGVNGLLGLDILSSQSIIIHSIPFKVSTLSWVINLFWVCFICNLSAYLYERLAKNEFKARQKLQIERERAERLLLNILPQSIAERLKNESITIAEASDEVTVLFADIVGFTQLAQRISPTELVELLNQIFSKFDHLAEQYGVEKIKTIGDAYMVVAGLPEHRNDHAQAIAEMAIAMQAAMISFNQQTGYALNIRIGINTGPVVAGVIGLKKFTYDLWGDTVNTASRMESHGIPGSIQVSFATYECLKDEYLFEERGLIAVKGKGDMNTYLLKVKRKDIKS